MLEGRGLTKRFGGVTALDDVDFQVHPGRITALLGGNGAGKSTLVACLSGARQPDDGEILFGGEPRRFRAPDDARRAGIAVVHQEPQMLEEQTVAANIYLGRLAQGTGFAQPASALEGQAARHLESLGIRDVDPARPMRSVAGAQRQLVEIARALVGEPRVLFLDEPNASLGEGETERLFRVVRGLRDRGVGVVLVSHRLREVYGIADHVVVMRDGRTVADADATELPLPEAVRLMTDGKLGIGLEPAPRPTSASTIDAGPVLELRGVSGPGFTDVSFQIRPGEVLGMSGLVGSGRTEIAHAVIGAARISAGSVLLDGRPAGISDPSDAVRQGIAFVPEGRRDAVFYDQSVDFNIRAGMWGRLSHGIRRLTRAQAGERVRELMARLSVKAAGPDVRASTLSGGNQQKLLFARALGTRPRLLILDEPTHGVDVGTKRETHDLIRGLAATGLAVWFISSEVEEIAELATRTVVIRQGRVAGELPGGASMDSILARGFGE
jgi:ABC-type sugar transport system ATPase subunit